MKNLRRWIILSWIALPLVMAGGSVLLRLVNRGTASPHAITFVRGGHAHGGILLLMSLAYFVFLDSTALSTRTKHLAAAAFFVGGLAQAGGFFLHAIVGHPGGPSIGTVATGVGVALLVSAIVVLIRGLASAGRPQGA